MGSHQLRALVRRQITLQARQTKAVICQIVFPLLILLLLFGIKLLIEKYVHVSYIIVPHEVDDPFEELHERGRDFLFTIDGQSISADEIGFFHSNGSRNGLLGNFWSECDVFQCSPFFVRFPTSARVDEFFYESQKNSSIIDLQLYYSTLGAFSFLEYSPTTQSITYIVQSSNDTDQYYYSPQCPNRLDREALCWMDSKTSYISLMNTAFARTIIDDPEIQIKTTTQRMPESIRDPISSAVYTLFSQVLLVLLPFILIFPLPVLMYTVVLEKQDKLREMMKLMGMKMRNYWLVMYFSEHLIYLAVVIVFCTFGLVFQYRFMWSTSWIVLFILFYSWSHSMIAWSFFLSSLFSKTIVAMIIGYLLALVTPVLALNIEQYVILTFSASGGLGPTLLKYFLLLIQPMPLMHSLFAIINNCEGSFVCWPSFLEAVTSSSELREGILFIFIDYFIYLFAGLYLDGVLPQTWGIRKSVLFPITDTIKFFKRLKLKRQAGQQPESEPLLQYAPPSQEALQDEVPVAIPEVISIESVVQETDPQKSVFEDDDVRAERENILNSIRTSKNTPVLINKLRKNYRTRYGLKEAVKGLYLSILEGEIFGLLGPNGAGKTTTISMLCGLFSPSGGTAHINGYDIRTDIDLVHLSMGLCPQHDVLWNDLTCQEHLLFYARLKGVSPKDEKQHVRDMLVQVGLADLKGNSKVKKLSGGMKRRLSIAISLIGNPRIVLLDEPTTGLDPTTRRHVWDIITAFKPGRSIILTTHSLEEADILCDRIGIITMGELRCVGTPMHLKNKFGEGYRISVNFKQGDEEHVHQGMLELLPNAHPLVSFAGNVVFETPKAGIKVSKLISDIEGEKERIRIKDWAFSLTTLEDIFLILAGNEKSNIN